MSLMIGLPFLYPVFALAPEEHAPPAVQTRTLKFFLFQEMAGVPGGGEIIRDASFFVGDQNPVVKDAFIEVRGVTKAVSSQTITIDVRFPSGSLCAQLFPSLRSRDFTLDASGDDTLFKILYTGNGAATESSLLYCLQQIVTAPTAYPLQIRIAVSGEAVSVIGAKLVLTYQFTPTIQSSALPPMGTLISPTFDTQTANGADFNWIMWKGTKPAGTRVRVQLATANVSSGPFSFVGPDCTIGTYFEPAESTSSSIGCTTEHHNKRYFRYKVQLCSNSDCASPGSGNPEVADVIVNWSP